MYPRISNYFPSQRVSGEEKNKSDWYANCIDYVIDAGLSFNDRSEDEKAIRILHGDIPDSFYKKTLNPYNSSKEKYTRFPATMRNLDIMSDIIRRYVSEYYKGIHQFIVGADNPNIALEKEVKLKEQIDMLVQQAFQEEFQKRYQEMMAEAEQQGQDPRSINPQEAMPNPEEFIENFKNNYIDKESKQGQDILDYITSYTNDTLIYLTAFYNYVSLGEAFTYTEIRNNAVYKECVPVIEAFPIPNNNFFVEDHDMFARKLMLSYEQIIDMFDDYLEDKDRHFLETYYAQVGPISSSRPLNFKDYESSYPELCSRFNSEERQLFKSQPVAVYENNTNLYEVWHVVWKGQARRGVLTYINEAGLQATRVVEEDYKLNKEAGDINIEWEYETQVYEGYRIGHRSVAIYPIKARPITYNRKGKLPYNGIMEVLPMMGKFSIIKLITPYQILRNIISYHREMIIAKNKLLILLMPESLIESDTEDRIYKMAADGVLYYDDSEDTNSLKAQQIRMLNASMGDYIAQLTNLMESIKLEARELVDMNAQRYGEIAQSSGAATTQQAISQSSMGSVIISQIFDEFRKTDYNRDLDYAKFAYIEGLNTSFWDAQGTRRYLSLDVNSFVGSDYSVTVRNNSKEFDKIQQLKQWAFSAAQNGDLEMAMSAITGDNVAQIKDSINKFSEIKRQHEEQIKQMEQMLKQEEIENKLREIEAKGEQDRLTEQIKYQYELQLKYMDVDMNLALADNGSNITADRELKRNEIQNKRDIEAQKLQITRDKIATDMYSKAADRQVRREDIKTKLQIAKTNKNKYDK